MQRAAVFPAIFAALATGAAWAEPPAGSPPAKPAASAGVVAANMDPGLWDWSVLQKTNSSMLTPEQIAKLPPPLQARAKAAAERAKSPRELQSCLTADSLRHGFTLQHDNNRDCTAEVLTAKPDLFEERVECHGKADILKSHITMKVLSRQSIDGELELERSLPKYDIHQVASGHIAGKRESADCGFVKPQP